jgi:DNA primase
MSIPDYADPEALRHLSHDDWTRLVEGLRQQVHIEDVIQATGGDYQLEPEGRELRGKEHSSLIVTPAKGLYQWHAQNEGGDVFTWLQRRHNCDLTAAVAMLASMNLPRLAPRPGTQRAPEPEPEPLPQDLHLAFYQALDEGSRGWWHDQGVGDEGIAHFYLGVHDHEVFGRCYTIPIMEAGRLVNLRMRLANPLHGVKDKYRPWAKGYGTQLFNADILTPQVHDVVITAGEKKAMVCWQHGIPAISPTGGCDNWKPEWTERLRYCSTVFIAFDPTESRAAWGLARKLGERALVAALPNKPDDFLTANGADAFWQKLLEAEPLADRDYWRRQMGGRPLWGKLRTPAQ